LKDIEREKYNVDVKGKGKLNNFLLLLIFQKMTQKDIYMRMAVLSQELREIIFKSDIIDGD